MTKQSFSKTTVSNISKFLLDRNFFYFIIPCLILYTFFKIFINIYNWDNNFLSYFPKEIKLNFIKGLDFIDISKLFLICFFSLLVPSIIIRFCIGIIFIKSQLKVQRFFSFLIIIIFIFTTKNDGFSFGIIQNKSDFIINISRFINILFIGFFIISLMIFYVNLNDNMQKRKWRLFTLFLLIISYLVYDWKKTKDFRELTKLNIENSELFFIIENTNKNDLEKIQKNSDYNYLNQNFQITSNDIRLTSNNDISNYFSLLTGLYPFETGIRDEIPSQSYLAYVNDYIKNNKKNDKFIYISNIGTPSSLGAIASKFNGEIICDNDLSSINKYSIIENLNPFLVFMPPSLIIKTIPNALCLRSISNIDENILADLYFGINYPTNKNKLIISFLNKKEKEFNIFRIIEKINETLESDKLKINILFLDSKSLFSKILYLNKKDKNLIVYKNITEIGKRELINYKQDFKFEYLEENKNILLSKNAEVINDRVSLNLNNSIIQSINFKRNFICFENENTLSTTLYYERKSTDNPQKIIANNSIFNNNCQKNIENSFISDVSLMINEDLFKKTFIFISDKL